MSPKKPQRKPLGRGMVGTAAPVITGVVVFLLLFFAVYSEPISHIWPQLASWATNVDGTQEIGAVISDLKVATDTMVLANEAIAAMTTMRLGMTTLLAVVVLAISDWRRIPMWIRRLLLGFAMGALIAGSWTALDVLFMHLSQNEVRDSLHDLRDTLQDVANVESSALDAGTLSAIELNTWRAYAALDAALVAGVASLLATVPIAVRAWSTAHNRTGDRRARGGAGRP